MFTGRGRQLTIYFGESDLHQHQTLYMAIVEMLRREGMSGATVTRGIAGFGMSSVVHTSAVLRLSMDLPVVVTVVDRAERIERVIPRLVEMAPNSLITMQDVEVVHSGIAVREGLPDVKVSEVMRREVTSVQPDSPLTEVVELLLDKDFTAVPVIDDQRRVVGMVSDNDLLTRGGMEVTLSLKRAADAEFVRQLHGALENPTRRVAEVMTRDVVTVSPDVALGTAARLMVERRLKRLPVIDAQGRLAGILGRLDVLNTIAAAHLPQWHPGARPAAGAGALVRDVMNREPAVAHKSATLGEILELLVGSAHKRVVVVDDAHHVVGIIADSDLVSRVSRESRPGLVEMLVARLPFERISAEARSHVGKLRGRSAAELMTREVVTLRDEMPVASALALSAERRVKRLPVVDGEGRLVGIVGRTEMMRALLGRSETAATPGSSGTAGKPDASGAQ
jgi:CBS-domain-containing membrane protein